MLFEFPNAIQAGIDAGKYVQVFSNGIPIGMARDAATGQFVSHAVGAVVDGNPLSPLISPLQFVMKGASMYQNHLGFQETYHQIGVAQAGLQSLQTSVGVLQATTALIGVGTVASVALGAVNLYQTLKLRKEVSEMRWEIRNGFIDLKQALKDQGVEIRQIIEQVAQDVTFEQHRIVLVRAFGLFTQALQRFRAAMQLQDISRRNSEIDAVRGMLFEVLADYTNPHLLEETSAPGKMRRLECAIGIQQAIVSTYQVQGEASAVSDRLCHLRSSINEACCQVIDNCQSDDELDFLFPEIARIRNHDLAFVDIWHNQAEWVRSLPASELKALAPSDFNTNELIVEEGAESASVITTPPEEIAYQNLVEKSHFFSLRDQLRFMFQPALRSQYEDYINQQASGTGYKTLFSKNLQQASDMTVANLYHYFKVRDESDVQEVAVMA
ncbi:hypothetical protein RIVM261_005610 [Rivularia sp. IAM M-261]|nr:hypothetical protein RIVM261_005610 [Rivularia sp. IAM M-261]